MLRQTRPIRQFPEPIQQQALRAFAALADSQKGLPEMIATGTGDNPIYHARGEFTYLTEHVGDLTHRMAQKHCEMMRYGFDEIPRKVREALRLLRNPSQFAEQVQRDLRANYDFASRNGTIMPFARYERLWLRQAQHYANAHAALEVWNRAQYCAREAAVCIGRQYFDAAKGFLEILQSHLDQGPDAWSDWASEITIEGGSLVPYRGPQAISESANDGYDLQAKYAHFNKLLFDDKLPTIPITWANLKNEGGKVQFQTKEVRPPPHPLRVRFGLEDRKAHHDLIPGSVKMKISNLYRRSDLALDQILIHEMIHVLMLVTGHLGETHGTLFQQEVRRCARIVGFHIPLKDRVEGMELVQQSKIKPLGVVLIERRDGAFNYVIMPEKLVAEQLDEIREAVDYSVRYGYFKAVWIYVIADQVWSDQAKQVPVSRKYGKTAPRLTDHTLLDDLHQNGKLLAHLTKQSLEGG